MFAIRQMIDDPQDFIAVPQELRHRPTEVIFIALDPAPEVAKVTLAGGGQAEALEGAAEAAITAFRGSGAKGTTADLLNDREAERRREE